MDGTCYQTKLVLSSAELRLRSALQTAHPHYGVHHRVSLSSFLDPRQFKGRECDCCFHANIDCLLTTTTPIVSIVAAIVFRENPYSQLIENILEKVGIHCIESTATGSSEEWLRAADTIPSRMADCKPQFRSFLANMGEWKTFNFVQEVASEISSTYQVLAEMAADAVLEISSRSSETPMSSKHGPVNGAELRRYFSRTSFDLVLGKRADDGLEPVLVVEIDGDVHLEKEKQRKDEMKNAICRSAGLPLLRVTEPYVRKQDRAPRFRKDRSTRVAFVRFLLRRFCEIRELQKDANNEMDGALRKHGIGIEDAMCDVISDQAFTPLLRLRYEDDDHTMDRLDLLEIETGERPVLCVDEPDDAGARAGSLSIGGDRSWCRARTFSSPRLHMAGADDYFLQFDDALRFFIADYLLSTAEDVVDAHRTQEGDVPQEVLASRSGERWTETEDRQLVSGFEDGLSMNELSQRHERTVCAIESRLVALDKIRRH